MGKRFVEILKTLLVDDGITSYKALSEELCINERTIRYDIDKINDALEENNFPLIDKGLKGKVRFENLERLEEIIDFFLEKTSSSEFKDEIVMFKTLFLQRINLNSLCDELDISRSNVKIIVKNIRTILKKYDLKLEIETHKGLILIGKEEDIRLIQLKFLNDYSNFNSGSEADKLYIKNMIGEYYCDIDLKKVKAFLDKLIVETGRMISDEPYNSLINYICIMIDRIKKGRILEGLSNENFFMGIREYREIDRYIGMVERDFSLEVPETEKIKLTDYFLGSHSYCSESSFFNFWIEIDIIARRIIKNFSKNMETDLSKDKALLDGIVNHLKPTIHRLKNDISLDNSILKDFLNLYRPVFEATKNSLLPLEEFIDISVSDDEVAFLGIHFKAALDRNFKESKVKKDVLVVCGSGYGTSKLVAQQVKESFDVNIKNIIPYHRLETMDLEDVDVVITTLDIKDEGIEKPVVSINTFLGDDDFKKLEAAGLLKKRTKVYLSDLVEVYKKNGTIEDEKSFILDLKKLLGETLIDNIPVISPSLSELLRDNILLKAGRCSWEDAIRISGEMLVEDSACTYNYIDETIDKIREFGSYMVTDGKLAIPHSRNENTILKTAISLVTFEEDIVFPNNTPVRTVLMFSSADGSEHLEALSNFMDLCMNHRFLKKLEDDISVKKVKDTIRKYEFLSSLGRHK